MDKHHRIKEMYKHNRIKEMDEKYQKRGNNFVQCNNIGVPSANYFFTG